MKNFLFILYLFLGSIKNLKADDDSDHLKNYVKNYSNIEIHEDWIQFSFVLSEIDFVNSYRSNSNFFANSTIRFIVKDKEDQVDVFHDIRIEPDNIDSFDFNEHSQDQNDQIGVIYKINTSKKYDHYSKYMEKYFFKACEKNENEEYTIKESYEVRIILIFENDHKIEFNSNNVDDFIIKKVQQEDVVKKQFCGNQIFEKFLSFLK